MDGEEDLDSCINFKAKEKRAAHSSVVKRDLRFAVGGDRGGEPARTHCEGTVRVRVRDRDMVRVRLGLG